MHALRVIGAVRRKEPGSERAFQTPVDLDPGSAALVEQHLDQVDAPGSVAGQGARGAPQPAELPRREAHPGPEARTRAAGLDLRADERASVTEDEVDLAPGARVSASQDAAATPLERARRDALARETELTRPRAEEAQEEPRQRARQEGAGAAGEPIAPRIAVRTFRRRRMADLRSA